MKYASLSIAANNIGDEIQIIAAQQFLPKIDAYMHRERINTYKFNEDYKIILNGWWLRHPKRFYTNDKIHPLLISIHINPIASKNFFTKKTIEYLIKNGPVGCRDSFTLDLMKKNNIPAYFSGCLTLTLQKNPSVEKKDYILIIDSTPEIIKEVKSRTKRAVYQIPSLWHFYNSFEERINLAKIYLKKIQEAHIVITNRLHGALPAIALETPTYFVADFNWNTIKERCSDYFDMFPTYSNSEFLQNKNIIDFENPITLNKHLDIRNNLIEKCKKFTGYFNSDSPINNFSSDFDIFQLIKSLDFNSNYNRRKVLYDIPIKYMIKNIYTRLILRKNDDDVL